MHFTPRSLVKEVLQSFCFRDIIQEIYSANSQPHVLLDLLPKLRSLRFFDPACGGGNFLVEALSELRHAESLVLDRLLDHSVQIDTSLEPQVDVHQLFGIELHPQAHDLVRTTLLSLSYREDAPEIIERQIICGNALGMDWSKVVSPSEGVLIVGNPPFVGQYLKTPQQRADMSRVFGKTQHGYLDYSTAWFKKATDYFQDCRGRFVYIAPQAVSRGLGVSRFFGPLFEAGWRISLGVQGFAWPIHDEAALSCVVIGMDNNSSGAQGPPELVVMKDNGASERHYPDRINGYLFPGPDLDLRRRGSPLSSDVPVMVKGSVPADGGGLLVKNDDELAEIRRDPLASPLLRPFIGAQELLSGRHRYCLWAEGVDVDELTTSALLRRRFDHVRHMRESSSDPAIRAAADAPHLFQYRRQPAQDYVCVPRHVSGNRDYLPVAVLDAGAIASDATFTCPMGDGLAFAIASSAIFWTWLRLVGGTLGGGPRFSNTLVWNNFPLPKLVADQVEELARLSALVLDARATSPKKPLLNRLYNPKTMPEDLRRAHQNLDVYMDRLFDLSVKNDPLDEEARLNALFSAYARAAS